MIIKRSDGFTLLEPEEAVRSWWRDRKKKEQPGVVPITEEGDQLGWIESLVPNVSAPIPKTDREFLVRMIRKCTQQMLEGRVN